MFDFTEANKWLKDRGQWKVLESSSDDKAVKELNKLAERQPRGKSIKTGRNLAEVRRNSSVYYFESTQGNSKGEPQVLIFIIGFGNSDCIQSINDLMGCEPSGAVSPEHMFAVEALSDSCTDFEHKIKEIVKKVVNGEKINDEEQKALIRTFLPPYQEGYEVQPGLIGGGMGFMPSAGSVPFSKSSASFVKFMSEAAESPEMQKFVQRQLTLEDPKNQKNQSQHVQRNPNDPFSNLDPNNPENQQQDTHADPNLVLHETSLVALITSGVPLNRTQIRSVLKSLESSVVYENDEGRQISATLAALETPNVLIQIDEFFNSTDQEIVKYREDHNIRPTEKYNAIKNHVESEKRKKRDSQKTVTPAKPVSTPAEDLNDLADYLDAQREIDPPHHEVEKPELIKPRDPKLTELTVNEGDVTIKNEIRTDKHQRRV